MPQSKTAPPDTLASPPRPAGAIIDAVVIGRNEGARLLACLATLIGKVRRLIYVDSGSTDGSVLSARAAGAEVVELDLARPFTAARARNAGLARLAADPPDFVQVIDGDCTLAPGWIGAALAAFLDHPRAVVVCGRRRERFPEASVWNRMADREWNTPVGQTRACGGDALMRYADVVAVGGYRDSLIAGEEPELCLRLIRAGGQIWRIDAEMTLHDAAITRLGQWWRRSVRAGYAFAEGAALYGHEPEAHWVAETRRALIWGATLPATALMLGLLHPVGLLLLLAYPAQILRLALRDRPRSDPNRHSTARRPGPPDWGAAAFSVLGKFAEAQGVLSYLLNRLRRRQGGLIEYK